MNEVNVKLFGFSRIDYDKKPIRKTLRQQIALVRDEGRSLVSGASPSGAGAYPGRRSGVLQRAIKSKVLRSGLAAVARPEKTARMGKDFYPGFLVHGVKQRKGKSLAHGLRPRKDPMPDALARREAPATEAIRLALESALVPRK